MKRSLEDIIKADVGKKIVLLSGPRQVGKTTLAKALYPGSSEYFNMDNEELGTGSWRDAQSKKCVPRRTGTVMKVVYLGIDLNVFEVGYNETA